MLIKSRHALQPHRGTGTAMETANATKKTKTGITELQTASIFSIADRMALKLILNTPNGNTETTFVGIRIRISGGSSEPG